MTTDFVWMRREFPWIGYGFIQAVHPDAVGAVVSRLRALDFEFFEMNRIPGATV
jgi:hypothetical protein